MALRFPVISHGAEYLVMGYLMRRNILTYKAPPGNEGYDLICIHPDPRQVTKQLRIQVKSRYQTDCDRGFPVKQKSIDAFDYLIIVFQNIGNYYRKQPLLDGLKAPEIYTLPADFIRQHHRSSPSGWEKVMTKGLDLKPYSGETGFELIANELGIAYPGLPLVESDNSDITERLNEIYAEEDSSLDPGIMALQAVSIGNEQW